MKTDSQIQPGRRSLLVFLVFQAAVVCGGVAWAAWRVDLHYAERELPVPLNEPLKVAPLYDEPGVVSDEQLVRVLTRLRPRLRGPQPKINLVDHSLRFWGVEAVFADPKCLSGVEMLDLLLDHRQYSQAWGDKALPLLIDNPDGIGIRTQEGAATASHVDHTLATLSEVGTTLDYPVITPGGETELRRALEWSLRQFSLNQVEYEWSALAYVLYMPDAKRWFSTEGQVISFDLLADRIMRQKPNMGICFGNHRNHALVMLLRVDVEHDTLSVAGRERIIEYLKGITALFVANQHEDGYWDQNWPGPEGETLSPMGTDPMSDRMLATGHVLEWWALAPQEVHPPKEVLFKAGQWLSGAIEGLSEKELEASYVFLTHAGRALALWRGRFPAEVIEPQDFVDAATP
jgi:hypothetical protein